ncbi:MAG: hypothetical protein QXO16_08530 [Archaeoglobaceae archaeon]
MNLLRLLMFLLLIQGASAQISSWVDPSGYESYEDAKIVYVTVFQFGYHVDAVQKNNIQIIYPSDSTSSTIHIPQGERVVFRVKTIDVTHAFYIFHYMPYPEEKLVLAYPGVVAETEKIVFDTVGKFKIRDPIVCDALNPFDYADIIVEPNLPLFISIALTIPISALAVVFARMGKEREIDLLKLPLVGRLLKSLTSRISVFSLQWVNLVIFMFIIITGFFGNPNGGENFSIIVVWVLWFALVEYSIFFSARAWCTMCPMPLFGEWIARRGILKINRKFFSLNRPWPKSFDNMWGPAIGFLILSLFIVWIVTRPVVTAILFLALILIAIFCHLYNPLRYFCRSLCPASGYIGYHSNASIFTVGVKDPKICLRHRHKDCINGNKNGYGCPWTLYPGMKSENTYCGQCFECTRSCPVGNVTLKLRNITKVLSDLSRKAVKANGYDEAWMGFIRFSLAIFYELVFFSAWGLKYWGDMHRNYGANLFSIGTLMPSPTDLADWFKWALLVSAISLFVFPAIFYFGAYVAKRLSGLKIPTSKVFLAMSYSLAPFGLFIWMSFALSLILVNWTKILNVLTDPFGLGWDLFGTGKRLLKPFLPAELLYLQIPFILVGLFLGVSATYLIAKQLTKSERDALKLSFPVSCIHLLSSIVAIWVVVG